VTGRNVHVREGTPPRSSPLQNEVEVRVEGEVLLRL